MEANSYFSELLAQLKSIEDISAPKPTSHTMVVRSRIAGPSGKPCEAKAHFALHATEVDVRDCIAR